MLTLVDRQRAGGEPAAARRLAVCGTAPRLRHRPRRRRRPHRRQRRRRDRRSRVRARLRGPGRAQARARARRRSRQGQGQRRQGPHPASEDVEASRKGGAAPARESRGAAAAGGGVGGIDLLPWPKVDFAKFGAGRSEAAVAHQEDLRREPAPQLGDDPARHQPRRRRHHRPRSVPRAAEQGEREERRQGQHARRS